MQITSEHIGQSLYPIDNSWSVTIGSSNHAFLAGTAYKESELVEIVSAPIKVKVKHDINYEIEEKEFVIVRHNGHDHLILNHFYKSKEEVSEAHKRMQQYIKMFPI